MSHASDKSRKKRRAHKYGIIAELISIWYLRLQGYKIISHRYKNHYGEIDIIAIKQDVYCFIEVKFRQNIKTALESIDRYKKDRIIKSAIFWQSQHFYAHGKNVRFDVIILSPFRFPMHLKNAFMISRKY